LPAYQTCATLPPFGVFFNKGAITMTGAAGYQTATIQTPMVNSGTIMGTSDSTHPARLGIYGNATYGGHPPARSPTRL
jgi:hypothetical protein